MFRKRKGIIIRSLIEGIFIVVLIVSGYFLLLEMLETDIFAQLASYYKSTGDLRKGTEYKNVNSFFRNVFVFIFISFYLLIKVSSNHFVKTSYKGASNNPVYRDLYVLIDDLFLITIAISSVFLVQLFNPISNRYFYRLSIAALNFFMLLSNSLCVRIATSLGNKIIRKLKGNHYLVIKRRLMELVSVGFMLIVLVIINITHTYNKYKTYYNLPEQLVIREKTVFNQDWKIDACYNNNTKLTCWNTTGEKLIEHYEFDYVTLNIESEEAIQLLDTTEYYIELSYNYKSEDRRRDQNGLYIRTEPIIFEMNDYELEIVEGQYRFHLNLKTYLTNLSLDEEKFRSITIKFINKEDHKELDLPINYISDFEVLLVKK
jgi:hypothetical protein